MWPLQSSWGTRADKVVNGNITTGRPTSKQGDKHDCICCAKAEISGKQAADTWAIHMHALHTIMIPTLPTQKIEKRLKSP